MLELKDFEAAYNKVQEVVLPTKLIKSDYFSDQTGNDVYLKPENMQLTGAYKIRGAYYKISTLSEEEKAKGLITASAGNHAQGVALAAARQGVKATIVMPTTTPLIKVNRTKSYGAEVVLYGNVYDEACQYALKLAKEKEEKGMIGFLTQPVLTEEAFENLKRAKEELSGYILGGVIPVVSARNARFMDSEINGINVDPKITELYEGKTRAESEDLAVEISVEIMKRISGFTDGYYLMTPFGRTGLIVRIMKEFGVTDQK